jgi:hypothetical protein
LAGYRTFTFSKSSLIPHPAVRGLEGTSAPGAPIATTPVGSCACAIANGFQSFAEQLDLVCLGNQVAGEQLVRPSTVGASSRHTWPLLAETSDLNARHRRSRLHKSLVRALLKGPLEVKVAHGRHSKNRRTQPMFINETVPETDLTGIECAAADAATTSVI